MATANTLWAEEFRPSIDKLILPKRILDVVNGYVKDGDVPNMLFSGRAGTSKTSTALAIAKALDAEYVFINGSDETGKGQIISKVESFSTGVNMSSTARQRLMIIDEADRISRQGQDALKCWIEKVSSNCRFIFTCNTPSMVIEPIKSRCLTFDFNTTPKETPELMVKTLGMVKGILAEKGVSECDNSALVKFIAGLFPDYRKILNRIQAYVTAYGKVDTGILGDSDASSIASELYPILKSKRFEDCRKWVYQSQYTIEDIIPAIFGAMRDDSSVKQSVPSAVLVMNEYQYKSAFVANQKLNTLAMCVEIMGGM